MGEWQVPRWASLLQLSKKHHQSWKAIQRRSATADALAAAPYATSGRMVTGAILACLGNLLLLIAFCTCHWMESRRHAYSEFVKLGLWEICFNNYHHHSFQFYHEFSGCHWVYSAQYRIIWEFVMPPWFLAVQGLVTVSFLLSVTSLILLALIYFHIQIKTASTTLTTVIVQNLLTGSFLLIAIIVFGIKAQEQRWMPHQLYNYYGWSYWLAFVSILFHGVSAWVLLKDVRKRKVTEAILSRLSEEPLPT